MNFYRLTKKSSKPILHLSHANGFLPPTYKKALQPLVKHYQILSLKIRPLWEGENPKQLNHWSLFADDLIRGLDSIEAKGIVAVGHSLGGVVTLYAAIKRPDLFSRVVLLDPTLLDPERLRKIRIMRFLGLETRRSLVQGALRRRNHWQSVHEAFVSFKEKQLFKTWPQETVRAYAKSITGSSPRGGVDLIYPPEWEARIYQTIPTDVWKAARRLTHPTLVLSGSESEVFTSASGEAFRKANRTVQLETIPGTGHLLAQEKPLEVGKRIAEFLR